MISVRERTEGVPRRTYSLAEYAAFTGAARKTCLACFILLMMWVRDEVDWDRFHKQALFIYRLESNIPAQPAPLILHLKANYPEIADPMSVCGQALS